MAQQKQRKQLILTDNKDISTYLVQTMQTLATYFYDWWHKKFHVYKAQRRKLKIKNILFYTATTTYYNPILCM